MAMRFTVDADGVTHHAGAPGPPVVDLEQWATESIERSRARRHDRDLDTLWRSFAWIVVAVFGTAFWAIVALVAITEI